MGFIFNHSAILVRKIIPNIIIMKFSRLCDVVEMAQCSQSRLSVDLASNRDYLQVCVIAKYYQNKYISIITFDIILTVVTNIFQISLGLYQFLDYVSFLLCCEFDLYSCFTIWRQKSYIITP